jgi:hypothetical protein
MDTIREALQVLRRAEQSLRDLLAKAATNGRYDDLMRLGDLARELAALVAKTEGPSSSETAVAVSPDPLGSTQPRGNTAGGRSPGRTGTKKRSYPKFLRDGETIIKLGWSKSAKAEYEHKAPKRVLAHLVAALVKLAATKKRATMDDVLPLKDPITGSEVPAYQAYLCLAWLRSVGIVTQHGRQGYSLPGRNGIDARVEERWSQLATR